MNIAGNTQKLLRFGSEKSLLWLSVRYNRKPRWVPIAKSKMYKIRELPYQPIHEEDEINRLQDHYHLYNRSLWSFQSQINQNVMAINQSATNEVSEEVELERIIAETDRDNSIVQDIREKQRAIEWKQIEADIISQKAQKEEEKIEQLLETEEKIKAQLEKIKKIITKDNLDEAIEKALGVEIDYNYAIDKDGNMYKGRLNIDNGEVITDVQDLVGIQVQAPVGK